MNSDGDDIMGAVYSDKDEGEKLKLVMEMRVRKMFTVMKILMKVKIREILMNIKMKKMRFIS